jgi:hypothetical protein
VEATVELARLARSGFCEQALGLSARIRDVTVHDIHHGAAVALAIAHLHLQPEVDLHAIEPRFPL